MAEYGQFGQATYDESTKEWQLGRNYHACNLRQIGSSRVVVPSATVPHDELQHGSRQREKQVQNLVQSYPELQPAAISLLVDFGRVSEAVENASARHDPVKGELLVFGSIPDAKGKGLVDAAASVSGPTGSDMRVVRLSKQMHPLSDPDPIEASPMTNEGTIWKGPGVPIQSMHFSQPTSGSHAIILAVRLIREVVLFRPRVSISTQLKSGPIELNQFLRLSIDEAARLPFAHVAFNPWTARQFAVVDQAGSWAVWELDEGKLRTTVSLLHRDDLVDGLDDGVRNSVDDGWGRISWITASTVLVICNRRKLMICDYETSTTLVVPEIVTVLDDSVGWNLDVVVPQAYPSHIILLTTSHIAVYHITQDEEGAIDADCVMCTRHFRNGADLSQRLHVCQDDDEVLILISSDLTPTVIYYRLDTSDPDRITCSDPMQLDIVRSEASEMNHSRVVGMYIRRASQSKVLDSQSEDPSVQGALWKGARFYSMTTLHQDMSVMETFYVSEPEKALSSSGLEAADRAVVTKPKESSHGRTSRDPISKARQQKALQNGVKSSNDWTISYELTMRQLNNPTNSMTSDVGDAIEAILARLADANAENDVPNETLQEQFSDEVDLHDIEALSSALEKLQHSLKAHAEQQEEAIDDFDTTARSGAPVLNHVGWPPTLQSENFLDLAPLHLSIVDNWISPLQGVVPEVVRSVQEQNALRIAADVGLARLVIRSKPQQDSSNHRQGRHVNFQLPVRASGALESSRATPSLYFDASSQPQSSARATPSSPSPSAASTTTTVDQPLEVTGLGRYTTFSNPPSSALPRSLNRVLAHWTLGANPGEYDWRSATRRVDRQVQEAEDEELTERDRIRQQKRKERHERRQQRHEEERQRQELLHSQAPEIMESQPTQGFSQTTAGSQMPASQILPGRFGGRPPPKKKRKSGF